MRTYHIPVFVPHKGCPHDCVFCNQKKITGHTEETTPESVKQIIEQYLESISANSEEKYIEVAFFGGSFTGIEEDIQKSLMQVASSYLSENKVQGIRCSTRPDYINAENLAMLKSYGMSFIELGVQSTDESVLSLANRGHSFDDVKRACALVKDSGISLGLQMMTGLPGDTIEKSINTARDIISLKPDCVRIYPTLVMEGTHLMDMYKSGEYIPFDLDKTVDLCAQLLTMFHSANIPVIRLGLQTTDNINADTVAGPYHPAIGELCTGRIFRNAIEKHFDGNTTVRVHPSMVSPAVGHKGENKEYFRCKYGIDLKVIPDNHTDKYNIVISDNTFNVFD